MSEATMNHETTSTADASLLLKAKTGGATIKNYLNL
jgi:hypothetical protein